MTQTFRLQPLLDLANERLDAAARILGELISGEGECQRKLETLEAYRVACQARFQQAATKGMAPDAWRNYVAFLGHVDKAVADQRMAVEASRQATSLGQQAWLAERNKVKAFDTLSRRHQAIQTRRILRDEQRLSDEHAARTHRDRSVSEDA